MSGGHLRLKEVIKVILVSLAIVIFLRVFVIGMYIIPSSSMENTLLTGDIIVINKLSYGLKIILPGDKKISNSHSIRLIDFKPPKRDDIIVFQLPHQPQKGRVEQPVDYIKRVVGLPGDKVEIVNKKVFVNGHILPPMPGIVPGETLKGDDLEDPDIYPPGARWNEDNYGPVLVPYKGCKVELNPITIEKWAPAINLDLGRDAVSSEGGKVLIDGEEKSEYFFSQNYYFVMGDNRSNSRDSRFWGFLPEGNIIGKAFTIFLSLSEEDTLSGKFFRKDRIFKNL